ncbi:MAG: hypothetical protein FWF73_06530 [Spirochaetes bacterium]|nr:hypothetical protein [Spirochaetota bacterium]
MHIAKLAAFFLLLFHTLIPAQNLQLYVVVSIFLTLIMIYSGGMPSTALFFKNIPMFFFAAVFFVFMFFPGMTLSADKFLTLFKIILIFNISLAASSWLGRGGFLFCLKFISVQRLKLFLLLLSRSLASFERNVRAAAVGVQLRIELTGKQKLLVPKYYVRNLIMKELYSFQHSQAALASRLYDHNVTIYARNGFAVKDLLSVCVMASAAFADIFIQTANIKI